MNKVLENIITRRSTRSFTNQKISKEDLELITKAAIYAPSGMNRQSWHFTVLQNKEKQQELARIIANNLGIKEGSYDFYKPDVLIMASNEYNNVNGLADCACAMQNMFLMANELGIGSVWINQLRAICDEAEVRTLLNELGIPQNHVVWGMAALGYAAETPAAKPRQEGTVHYVE